MAVAATVPLLCASPERLRTFPSAANFSCGTNESIFCLPSASESSRCGSHRPTAQILGKAGWRGGTVGRNWGTGARSLSSRLRRRDKGQECDGRSECLRHRFACRAVAGGSVGSLDWMLKSTPYEVLGVSEGSSEEDIKSAFRAMIKEYHPDVYQGMGDADAITQRLLRAYELLMVETDRKPFERKSLDPFEDPECLAADIFVNEPACIGRGCPYSCVERAPDVFQFASDTDRARVINQEAATRKAGEYHVQLAIGQCPNNCIHVVTPQQRLHLEEILKSVLEGTVYSGEMMIMEGLIARARFENGRFQPPKRKPKSTEKWVDWY